MGGLSEAAVKSFKKQLYRAINPSILTFQEFQTLMVKIEAILNPSPTSHLILMTFNFDPKSFLNRKTTHESPRP